MQPLSFGFLQPKEARLCTDGYDVVWFSDDGGKTYELAKDTTGKPAQLWGMSESALAETPEGGVIISMRNEGYHRAYPATVCMQDNDCPGVGNACVPSHCEGRPCRTCTHEPPKVNCDCRGKARSTDGGEWHARRWLQTASLTRAPVRTGSTFSAV